MSIRFVPTISAGELSNFVIFLYLKDMTAGLLP